MSMTFAAARRRSSIALRRLAQTACTLSHASLSTSPTSSSASLRQEQGSCYAARVVPAHDHSSSHCSTSRLPADECCARS